MQAFKVCAPWQFSLCCAVKVVLCSCVQELGSELYRYKGIFAAKGMDAKFVFSGVHCFYSCDFVDDNPWKEGEQRECKFVIIGKNIKQLHEERLYKEF